MEFWAECPFVLGLAVSQRPTTYGFLSHLGTQFVTLRSAVATFRYILVIFSCFSIRNSPAFFCWVALQEALRGIVT